MNEQMKNAHREAALCVFHSRNADIARLCEQGMIDLHGLHVVEAETLVHHLLPIFFEHFAQLRGMGTKPVIRLVTGSGHHSIAYGQGNARLLPAVQAQVQELLQSGGWGRNWRVQQMKDGNGFVSGIILSC